MKRIARLGHTDAASPIGKKLRVSGRGILYASVAMMNHVSDVCLMFFIEFKSLFESRDTALHFECRMQAMAYDTTSVGVRKEGQIGEASTIGDVGDVCHNEIARFPGDILRIRIEQVLVLMERMGGVGGAGAITSLAQH